MTEHLLSDDPSAVSDGQGVDGQRSAEARGGAGAPRPRLRRTLPLRAWAELLRGYGIFVVFVLVAVGLSLFTDQFLTVSNLSNLVDQETTIGLIACAGTLVMIAGGFDLSVGGIYVVVSVVVAKLVPELGVVPAMLAGLLAGGGLGLVNGVVTIRINPLITTLSTSIVFAGVALLISGGFLLRVPQAGFTDLGNTEVLGLFLSSWVFAAVAIVLGFVLARSVFGRYVYAVGGNREAARLSGVRVGRITAVTYVLSGVAAGLAAVLYTSRVGLADPAAGSTYALAAIAAIVVGGTSISGGEGSVARTVVGVLFLGLVTNGFLLLGVDPLYQQIVQGSIILTAVAVDDQAKRRRA